MAEPLVFCERKGPIAHLVLNRPEKRNALSRELLFELSGALGDLASAPEIRAIVLSGAGPSFCAGMDLKEAAAIGDDPDSYVAGDELIRRFARVLDQLYRHPTPTIAAVHGDVLAGGAGLMSACDLALAAASARFGYPEVRRGLTPAVIMHDVCRQIGERRARQLLLSGSLITSTIACSWGLVNEIAPDDQLLERAMDLAASFVECAPNAVATTKTLIEETYNGPRDLTGAAEVSAAIRRSDEAREGIRAFLEKRKPAWASPAAGSGE